MKKTYLHTPRARQGSGFFVPSSPSNSWKLKRPQGPLGILAAELSGEESFRAGSIQWGVGPALSLSQSYVPFFYLSMHQPVTVSPAGEKTPWVTF